MFRRWHLLFLNPGGAFRCILMRFGAERFFFCTEGFSVGGRIIFHSAGAFRFLLMRLVLNFFLRSEVFSVGGKLFFNPCGAFRCILKLVDTDSVFLCNEGFFVGEKVCSSRWCVSMFVDACLVRLGAFGYV